MHDNDPRSTSSATPTPRPLSPSKKARFENIGPKDSTQKKPAANVLPVILLGGVASQQDWLVPLQMRNLLRQPLERLPRRKQVLDWAERAWGLALRMRGSDSIGMQVAVPQVKEPKQQEKILKSLYNVAHHNIPLLIVLHLQKHLTRLRLRLLLHLPSSMTTSSPIWILQVPKIGKFGWMLTCKHASHRTVATRR